MTTETPGFFSDPKAAIALLALVISIAALLWTISNQWEQNRRWNALNLGRVELADVGFMIWKELSKQEVTSTNWGYNPSLFDVAKDRVYQQKYQLPYELILAGPDHQRIPQSGGFYTLGEARDEIARLDLQNHPPEVLKHYQVQFIFKNTGSTPAIGVAVKIVSTIAGPGSDQPIDIFTSTEPVDLLPSSSFAAMGDFATPLKKVLPQIMKYSVLITWKDVHKGTISREVALRYDGAQNTWTYGH